MKTNLYKTSIIIFGLVVPVVLSLIVIAVCYGYKSSTEKKYKKNKSDYLAEVQSQKVIDRLQKDLSGKKDQLEAWESLVAEESIVQLGNEFRKLQAKYPSDVLRRNSANKGSQSSGMGKTTTQNSNSWIFDYNGTFTVMQKALFELESEMPQMQLDKMTIRKATNDNLLQFNLNYTSWEK